MLEELENVVLDSVEEFETDEVLDSSTDGVFLSETDMAPSMEIQAEEITEVFRDIPELQFENWAELSLDERIEVLQTLEHYVAEIEHRPEIPVVSEDMEEGLLGYFSLSDGMLHLSNAFMECDDFESYVQTMDTFFHEGRHAYQYSNAMCGNVVEQNQEYVVAWRLNMDEGLWGYRDASIYGFEDYYLQPIEVDARAFSETVLDKLELR